MEDWDLFHKIRDDDQNAFDALFKKYYKPLVRYIRAYTHDLQAAEDIVQNVFFNFWNNRNSINITNTVSGYLHWVSYTNFVDQYRTVKRREHILDQMKEEALRESIAEDREITDKRIKKLKQLIEALPPTCRSVLELNKMRGLNYDEIAEKLHISKKTVESHMRIAFNKIREGFEKGNLLLIFIRRVFQFR